MKHFRSTGSINPDNNSTKPENDYEKMYIALNRKVTVNDGTRRAWKESASFVSENYV